METETETETEREEERGRDRDRDRVGDRQRDRKGDRSEFDDFDNIFRVWLGTERERERMETVTVIETCILLPIKIFC